MNRTYGNCKSIITAGRYTYDDMFNNIDLFLMVGRITEAEYVELTGLLTPPEPTPEPEPEVTEPVTPVEPPAEDPEAPVEETV